ncbi:hypothetical protein NMG60_11009623 [Bertholletia excelsa]
MDLESPNVVAGDLPGCSGAVNGGEVNSKRERCETTESEEEGGTKKQKIENYATEERGEKSDLAGDKEEKEPGRLILGPKTFASSMEMFDYFYNFLHFWSTNFNVNKYEHMVLLDLLKKGHLEPDKKIGKGIVAFQVRFHSQWRSRCFFIVKTDKSVDDFTFRKCVDHILPLPDSMQIKTDVNKALGGRDTRRGGKVGGGGRGGGRDLGHGGGRGVKSRD